MNILTIIAVAVFLGSAVLSQKLAVNAGARLDDATKLKIVEVFPKRNINYTIIVFLIVIAFLVAIYLFPQHFAAITIGYAGVFAVYIFTKLVLNVRKLKEIEAPADYVRTVIISFGVFIGGAVAAGIIAALSSSGRGY